MESNVINTQKQTNLKSIVFISSLVSMVFMLLAMAMYLFGGITYFNEDLNPISAVNLILQLFNTTKFNIFNSFSAVFVGILYIIYIITLVKCSILVINSFNQIRKSQDNEMFESYKKLQKNVGQAISKCIFVLGISFLFKSFVLNTMAFLIILSAIIVFLNKEFVLILANKNNELIDKILKIVEKVMFVVVLVLLGMLLVDQYIYQLSNGTRLIFDILPTYDLSVKQLIYLVYHYALKNILFIIYACIYFSAVCKSLDNSSGLTINRKDIQKKLISLIVNLTILMFVDRFIEINLFDKSLKISTSMITEWLKLSKSSFISMIILLVSAIFLLTKEENKVKKAVPKVQD